MLKIYLKDSKISRLADRRIRIVRETNTRRPDENEDLVFEVTGHDSEVPADALNVQWTLEHRRLKFFTTADRCKKLVSPDPSYWTAEKLKKLADIEKRIWNDWYNGYVYGYVIEEWNAAERCWKHVDSLWGMYGADELASNVEDWIARHDCKIPVCIDGEEMKYEFDNCESAVDSFE